MICCVSSITSHIVSWRILFKSQNHHTSEKEYEAALEHPVIHIISVELHNVLDCELGDHFCVIQPIMEVNKNVNQLRSTP
jgi:hypothetical protein